MDKPGLYLALAVIALPTLAYAFFRFSIGVMIIPFESAFAINDTVAGGIVSVSVGVVGVGVLLSGYIAERYGDVTTALLGFALFSVPMVSVVFSSGLLAFSFLFTLASFGSGLMMTPAYALAASYLPRRMGTAVSIVTAAYNAGGLVGPVFVGYLITYYSWDSPFLAIGMVGLIFFAVFLWFFRGGKGIPLRTKSKGAFGSLLRNRMIVVLVVADFFADLAFLSYASWTPKFIVSTFGASGAGAETVYAFFGIGIGIGGIGTFVSGALFDRIGGKKGVLLSCVAVSFCTLGIYTATSITMAIVMLVASGFVSNWFWTLLTAMAQVNAPEAHRTASTSLVQTAGFIGAFVGPGLAGLLGGAIALAMVCTVVLPYVLYGTVILLLYRDPKPPGPELGVGRH